MPSASHSQKSSQTPQQDPTFRKLLENLGIRLPCAQVTYWICICLHKKIEGWRRVSLRPGFKHSLSRAVNISFWITQSKPEGRRDMTCPPVISEEQGGRPQQWTWAAEGPGLDPASAPLSQLPGSSAQTGKEESRGEKRQGSFVNIAVSSWSSWRAFRDNHFSS